MSLSPHDRAYHEIYERASKAYQDTIDEIVEAARQAMREHAPIAVQPANDDRAEVFVAAVVRYVEDSRREVRTNAYPAGRL